MIKLTTKARNATNAKVVTPNLLFKIDGLDTYFSVADVSRLVRIGDPGLLIGDDWVIGGLGPTDLDVKNYLSYSNGATTQIQQQLSPDRSQGSSNSSITLSFVDKNEELSRLISPGFVLDELLGVSAVLYLGFQDTSYPEDYVVVFRGILTDITSGAGFVNMTLMSTEEKKRVPILQEVTAILTNDSGSTASMSSVQVDDPSVFATLIEGPDGAYDASVETGFRIADELFKYTGISGSDFTGVTRATWGSLADDHAAEDSVKSVYHLQGKGLELALKLMLSGWDGPFVTGVPATNFNTISPTLNVPDAIFFEGLDLEQLYGLTSGDYVTTTGASNGANNITAQQISSVEVTLDGTILVFVDQGFVDEESTSALCSFRSQYDTLPGGLKLTPAEVDVAQHQYLLNTFLGGFEFDFYIENIPSAKEWIELELYLPMGCFSTPRKARSSVTFTVGPIAGETLPVIDASNVVDAQKLKLQRSSFNKFINQVIYSYDSDPVTGDFEVIKIYESTASKNRIPLGNAPMEIQSSGMRTTLNAATLSADTANRVFARYQYGAEYIQAIELLFGVGFAIEIGDIVAVDFGSLKLTDTRTGTRSGGLKLMECINRTYDAKTGKVMIDLLTTAFNLTDRFARISPSSKVDVFATANLIPLKRSFGTKAYQYESRKWENLVGQPILVRNEDFSTAYESVIVSLDDSTGETLMTVSPALGAPPSEDMTVQVAKYPDTDDPDENFLLKTRFAYLSPTVQIVSSPDQHTFVVDPADIDKFLVGASLRLHDRSYSDDSSELIVESVDTGTNTVTTTTDAGFTLDNTIFVDLIGFKDGGAAYRWV